MKRRALSLVMALRMLLTLIPSAALAAFPTLQGDIDGDGRASYTDLKMLRAIITRKN